jgi:hypothetical protein
MAFPPTPFSSALLAAGGEIPWTTCGNPVDGCRRAGRYTGQMNRVSSLRGAAAEQHWQVLQQNVAWQLPPEQRPFGPHWQHEQKSG